MRGFLLQRLDIVSVVLKGQSSVEYLTTYGWVLLAAGIASAAYIQSVPGQTCNPSVEEYEGSVISVEDVAVNGDGELELLVENNVYSSVKITSANISGGEVVTSYTETVGGQEEDDYSIADVQGGSCSTSEVTLEYSYGAGTGETTTTLQHPGNLEEYSFGKILRSGDSFDLLIADQSVNATASGFCLGDLCSTTSTAVESNKYLDQSGGKMQGELALNQLRTDCLGDSCDNLYREGKDDVTQRNIETRTMNGTLSVKSIIPRGKLTIEEP